MEERWFDEELAGCWLGDGRLDRRLRQLVERMKVGFGESILDRLILDPAHDPPAAKTLSLYLTKIGRLCGYLARAKEPLVRNIVMLSTPVEDSAEGRRKRLPPGLVV